VCIEKQAHMKSPKQLLQLGCVFSMLTLAACSNSGTQTESTTDSTTKSDGSMTQTANQVVTSAKESLSAHPDSSFIVDAVTSNSEELKVLQAGIDMGGKAVKEHAKMMLADHKKLAKALDDYSAKKNMPVAAADRDKPVSDLDDITKKTGADRDKAWTSFVIKAHEKAIGKFEGAQNNVNDPELKTMIANTLPTLHAHLDMLNKAMDAMK
jgi:putative membrane protein